MSRLSRRLALDRPELVAWALYDWANSAMLTVVVTAVFPLFFARVAAADLPPDVATERFTLATTVCMLLTGLCSPVLGALADVTAQKKRFLAAFLALGAGATLAMFLISRGEWLEALVCFGLANLGASASFVFYDSLLPHVAREGEADRLSATGYALGYLGGGLALALCLALLRRPEWFGLAVPDPAGADPATSVGSDAATLPARLCFVLVAVWWVVFSIPLFRRVSEPERVREEDEPPRDARLASVSAIRTALQRLSETARELVRYRQAFLLLLAFLAYNDGIGTIMRMAVPYGKEIGIDDGTMLAAILVVQFVGVPCALLFGIFSDRVGPKRLILASIAVYAATSVLAWRMSEAWHFWLLAILVGLVQGGSQALSRSLFASLIPKHKSGEFFGLFSVLEKFAGMLGPAVFLVAKLATGSSRHAILSVVVFFFVGAWLLSKVDVEAGRRAAKEADAGVRPA